MPLESIALALTWQMCDDSKSASRPNFTLHKSKPICNQCGIMGYMKEIYYKLRGYPLGYKNIKSRIYFIDGTLSNNNFQDRQISEISQLSFTQEQCQQLIYLLELHNSSENHVLAHLVGSTSRSNPQSFFNQLSKFSYTVHLSPCLFYTIYNHWIHDIPWIIDTETTDHMINSVSFFFAYNTVKSSFVTLPNDHKVPNTHKGIAKIIDSLILNNVLCVHSFSFNILSANWLIHSFNCCLTFLNKFYFIHDLYACKTIVLDEKKRVPYYIIKHSLQLCLILVNLLLYLFSQHLSM